MPVTFIFFGRIAEIVGTGSLMLEEVAYTDEAIHQLQLKYPALKEAKFAVAVDKKIVKENTPLHPNTIVALLPPFSGG